MKPGNSLMGELIGGLANSVQVLSGLSNRLFGMMGYTGSQGSFQQAQNWIKPLLFKP